jgi:hypothetical protein
VRKKSYGGANGLQMLHLMLKTLFLCYDAGSKRLENNKQESVHQEKTPAM